MSHFFLFSNTNPGSSASSRCTCGPGTGLGSGPHLYRHGYADTYPPADHIHFKRCVHFGHRHHQSEPHWHPAAEDGPGERHGGFGTAAAHPAATVDAERARRNPGQHSSFQFVSGQLAQQGQNHCVHCHFYPQAGLCSHHGTCLQPGCCHRPCAASLHWSDVCGSGLPGRHRRHNHA